MIKLNISNIEPSIIDEANAYFPDDYLEELEEFRPNSYNESLVSRFMVATMAHEELEIDDFTPEINIEDEEYEDFFYSISHKENIIFVGISDDTIGLDIERYKERDESVFEYFSGKELEILGGKNLESFYLGWTAKESLIKYMELGIDDIYDIEIIRVIKEQNEIGGIIFSNVLMMKFEENYFKAYSGNMEEGQIYYSAVI